MEDLFFKNIKKTAKKVNEDQLSGTKKGTSPYFLGCHNAVLWSVCHQKKKCRDCHGIECDVVCEAAGQR